jgi:hypothetical protein
MLNENIKYDFEETSGIKSRFETKDGICTAKEFYQAYTEYYQIRNKRII